MTINTISVVFTREREPSALPPNGDLLSKFVHLLLLTILKFLNSFGQQANLFYQLPVNQTQHNCGHTHGEREHTMIS